MIIKIWVVNEFTETTVADAIAAGAQQIYDRIPPRYQGQIPSGQVGLFEVQEPEVVVHQEPEPSNPVKELAAMLATPLQSLTPSSSTTATRNALISLRNALMEIAQ